MVSNAFLEDYSTSQVAEVTQPLASYLSRHLRNAIIPQKCAACHVLLLNYFVLIK